MRMGSSPKDCRGDCLLTTRPRWHVAEGLTAGYVADRGLLRLLERASSSASREHLERVPFY
jgi:hypothetical protein